MRHDVESHEPLSSSAPISGLPGGVPPMCEFTSAPRTSSANALRRLVVGPKPGRMRPTAPRRANAANASSLIRSTTTTRNCAPSGVIRADAGPGAASAATAAEATARRRSRRERQRPRVLSFSLILTRNPPDLFDAPCRLLLEKLLEARRTLEGARGPAGRSSRSSRRRRSRRRRRAVATAAEAPTTPPRRKSNALPPLLSVVHGTIVPCASRLSVTCCST